MGDMMVSAGRTHRDMERANLKTGSVLQTAFVRKDLLKCRK